MSRPLRAPVGSCVQRIGEATARAFKTLAGVDKDKPLAAWVFALYSFLFLVAMLLVIAWLSGPAA